MVLEENESFYPLVEKHPIICKKIRGLKGKKSKTDTLCGVF